MTVALRPITDAITAHIDGELPDHVTVEAGERTSGPAAVTVIPLVGGEWLKMLADQWDNGEAPWQITCTGANRDQAEWLVDQVRAALFDAGPPSGVKRVRPDSMGAGVRPDRDVDPTVWVSTPVFYMTI